MRKERSLSSDFPHTHIHLTQVDPFLETQGWFIEQYVRNPAYDYTQERYRIALFTEGYQPKCTDRFHDVLLTHVSFPETLKVERDDDRLIVHDVWFTVKTPPTWTGVLVWLGSPQPVLMFSATQGFPCTGAVRLSFDCATLADQIQHAAGDAQCVREMLTAGRLQAQEG
jgi:hypothetical protein